MELVWAEAVCSLAGIRSVAEAAAAELVTRYAEPHRRYHDATHVSAVLRDSAILADELELVSRERNHLILAAGAHDVIYQCKPGEDERRSAAWAGQWLRRAAVGESDVARVEALVLTTVTHSAPPDDLTAHALLDADLAILGTDQATYEKYRAAVRKEYGSLDELAWRAGRAALMSGLLARRPLYRTAAARRRWETTARANIARELEFLNALG
ncbi:HD domain-containing protein [Amycolatopsis taiwanensis]|uniref:HD domain-containing protein n=1 Tax=Amycolatopsis taiwanensis TaxID=342230 RepID=UPI0004ACC7E9|nr:hypothetical protein [Amycolatopsis taiwanensis]